VVWLLFCFFLSLTMTAHARRREFAKGLLVGAALSLPLVPDITVWIGVVVRPVLGLVDALYASGFDLMRPTALVAPGLSLLLLATILVTGYLKKAGVLKRILVVVPLVAPALICLFPLSLEWHFALFGSAIGLACLSMAFAGFAGRIASSGHNRWRLFSVGVVGIGLVLLAWTAARELSGARSLLGWFPNEALFAIRPPGLLFDPYYPLEADWDWLAWVWVPRWITWVAVPFGAICLIVGLVASVVLPRLRKKAERTPSSGKPGSGPV